MQFNIFTLLNEITMTGKIKIMTAAIAAVLMFSASICAQAADNSGKPRIRKNKTQLIKENTELTATVDSLTAEIERYRKEMQKSDSLASEIMDIYEEEREKSQSISPENYTPEVTDSLLNLWYLHRILSDNETEHFDMDSVSFESNVPDEVYIRRIKEMNSFIKLPYNSIVRNYIILYSEKMAKRMPELLGLCSYYMPIFEEIFDEHEIPEELKAMAIIESFLNPTAVSRVGARGMWQFMYSTAKHYGLRIDSFVDERMDPVKSAHAAAEYLKDAYNIFGDWNLAIASYNCGAGNVNKAIRRSGGSLAFWDIYPYLPRETRGYVPAFVGALYTMTYYKEHGITPQAVSLPELTDTFKINKMLHFKQISEVVGIPTQSLKDLNPQYKHEIIPGNEREYILKIPYSYSNSFIDHEDSLYNYKATELLNPVVIKKIKDGGDGERIVHKVRNGEVLGRIAMKYRCSVSQIKRWNNLRSDNIRVGQRLVIYRGGRAPSTVSSTSAAGSSAQKPSQATKSSGNVSRTSSAGTPQSSSYTVYTVKSGESLYLIAKKFPGVSAQNIMDFNGIGSNIKPGMKIRIPKI